MYVHDNLESLYKHIPKDILPKEYGGSEKSLIELHSKYTSMYVKQLTLIIIWFIDNWREFLESEDSWMIDRMKMKSNEKLRPGKPIDPDLFGIQGSFRQLNID